MNLKRVIIADQSQQLLEGIRCLLNTVFDSVVMVADTESMLDAASRIKADMVVMNLPLGAVCIEDAIKRVRDISPGIKILVISIHDEPATVRRVNSAGADGFVQKRYAAEDLIPAVEQVMCGGSFFSAVQKR